MHPNQPLRCLLISPKNVRAYFDFKETCALLGAKAVMPPLGLLTVAAILPQQWQFRLLDLKTRDLSPGDWQWAELVAVGGMYTQKPGILEIIRQARRDHKFVVVGGVDPTSQPEVYQEADALVLDEGEASIPVWLAAWRQGNPRGVFRSETKPDITTSPVPRFDLLRLEDYAQMSVQFSRGCPFSCEFCDIIELLGRVPRTKTPEQLLAELDRLYHLGFRGQVALCDDNFVGNKRNVKRMLSALVAWGKVHHYPFYFSTEASLNMADDPELLALMRDAGLKYVYTGIETPDPDLLRLTKKRQNFTRPIVERVNRLHEHSIAVSAGFILGFDNERPGTDRAIIQCIEDTGVCNISVNLLIALPNTQLTRRLYREGRMLSPAGESVRSPQAASNTIEINNMNDMLDLALNFVTTRDRSEIVREYANILRTIHEPRRYMDRVLRTARKMRSGSPYRPGLKDLGRSLRAAVALSLQLTRDPTTRRLYWRNVLRCLPRGFAALEYALRHMALYLHLRKQTDLVLGAVSRHRCPREELVPR